MKNTALLVLIILLLAGCGGSNPDAEAQPTPTATPAITLEERATYNSGTAENPLRMLIVPTDSIESRLVEILVTELGVRRTRIMHDADLQDDLDLDEGLDTLIASVERDFEVVISSDDIAANGTFGGLIQLVQTGVGDQVRDAIFDRTALDVEVIPVKSFGDALDDLCASGSGIVSIPWLDGINYVAAVALNCGQPGLQVIRVNDDSDDFDALIPAQVESVPVGEVTPDAEANEEVTAEATSPVQPVQQMGPPSSGVSGVVIVNSTIGSIDPSVVNGRTFCRLNYDDFYSWMLPVLVFRANNIDLQRAADSIVDVIDYPTLALAVATGNCDVAALPRDVYDTLDLMDDVQIITETVTLPYGVMMYPLEVGLGVRLSLNEQLPALAEDPVQGRPLRLLLGHQSLEPVIYDDFAPLDAFVAQTGLDFAQLGD